jgi:NAD(P)H-nitrite reductase large subunit
MSKARDAIMANEHADYLILGNSAAAISAVESIRAADTTGSIVMVSPEPYCVYGRPLISYLLEGKTDEAHLDYRPESFYQDNDVTTHFGQGCAAATLDPRSHKVTLEDATVLSYGKLLVATGSVPFVPPIDGIKGADNVFTFLTLDDAKSAGAAATAATTTAHAEGRKSRVIVIGGGLIGLKAAEALHAIADEVVVLEMAPRILPAVLDDRGAGMLVDQLAARGIDARPGITTDHLAVEDGHIVSAHLTDDSNLTCDMVVAAVGVRPNSALLADASATVERGVVCDDRMQTSLADIYAAGDVTQTIDSLDGAKRPLALWPNAVAQGKVAGSQMASDRHDDRFEGSFAVNAVDFFDISLLTSGVINPDPDDGYEVHVFAQGTTYAKFVTKDDRLYGYILLNRPAAAGIYTAVIKDAMPVSSFDESFFKDEPDNLAFSAQDRWNRLHRFYPTELNAQGTKECASL